MSKGVILVPTDYTSVGDCAIEHGAMMAKSANRKLVILNVVKEQQEVNDTKIKIEAAAINATTKYGVETAGVVRVGSIFDEIGNTASELGAKFIVMGTHGAKGMQRYMGSYAMKVIMNSEVPFIIVQNRGVEPEGYDNIVMPLDLKNETKQKLSYVAEIARHFNSTVHLIFQYEQDDFFRKKMKGNIVFAKKYLTEHNVSFTAHMAEDNDIAEEIIRFSAEKKADLIAIMNEQDGFLDSLLSSSSREQTLITNNAEIPVLILNPRIASSLSSFTVSGGA